MKRFYIKVRLYQVGNTSEIKQLGEAEKRGLQYMLLGQKKKYYTAAQNSIDVRKISLCQILQEIKRRATHTILVRLALPKNIYVDIK